MKKIVLVSVFVAIFLAAISNLILGWIPKATGHAITQIEAWEAERNHVPYIQYDTSYVVKTPNEIRRVEINLNNYSFQHYEYPSGSRLLLSEVFIQSFEFEPPKNEINSTIDKLVGLGVKELKDHGYYEGLVPVEKMVIEINKERYELTFYDRSKSKLRRKVRNIFLSFASDRASEQEILPKIIYTEGDFVKPEVVSYSDLLTNGKKFDGKRIVVEGFLNWRFENTSIGDPNGNGELEDYIWIGQPSEFADVENIKPEDSAITKVEGVYTHGPSGHFWLFPGAINRVTKLEKIQQVD